MARRKSGKKTPRYMQEERKTFEDICCEERIKNPTITPRTRNQQTLQNALDDPDNKIVVATGSSGTGKTAFCVQKAAQMLKSGEVDKIVLTRPLTTVGGESIGYLPGELNSKMQPFIEPVYDNMKGLFSKNKVKQLLDNGQIEIIPLCFIRGRDLQNVVIIADEMQGSKKSEMLALLTRLGQNTRAFITGDQRQNDIDNANDSVVNGLSDLVERVRANHSDLIKVCKLNRSDVQRSKTVREVLALYGEE